MRKYNLTKSKSNEFNKKDNSLAAFSNAISHPAKLAILKVLAKKEICFFGDIAKELPLAGTTVYQHLHGLARGKLIFIKLEGGRNFYCINRKAVHQFEKAFDAFFGLSSFVRSN